MANHTVPKKFAGIDTSSTARPWYKETAGSFRPMPARADALTMLAEGINLLGGQMPRVLWNQSQKPLTADNTGSAPLYVSAYDDSVQNATSQILRIIALPRVSGTGDATAAKTGVGTESTAAYASAAVGAPAAYPESIFEDHIYIPRDGGWGAGAITDGIGTANGYTILDACLQEDPRRILDDTVDDVVPLPMPNTGNEILETDPEALRDIFHKTRQNNLTQIISWGAEANAGAWQTPVSTSVLALVTTSASFVNVIDQAVTARSATSPGISSIRQYCGHGEPGGGTLGVAGALGASTKVRWQIFAASVTNDGEVKLIGPDHRASNDDTITVTAGGAAAWYGDATNFIYLNSTVGGDDVTTARNKIDAHFRILTSGSLYVYAINAWEVYV